jgi:hypothetical protein
MRWRGFVEFSTSTGRFGGYDVLRERGLRSPMLGGELMEMCTILQQLAMRLLSQVTSSSCCERNWSTYGNLHTLKKSRLEQSKAKTMVYVHSNLHLIYKDEEQVVEGKDKDVGCIS